jgi:hypothetical protein
VISVALSPSTGSLLFTNGSFALLISKYCYSLLFQNFFFMRLQFLLIGIILFFKGMATVHTVSNDPLKPAQFTNPTAAQTAASPGDTLYIYGSPNSYGDFVINKSITIIGAGFNTRKEVFYKTAFRNLDLATGTLSNVTVDGIVCERFGLPSSVVSYSNFTLRNIIVFGTIGGIAGSPVSCGSTFSNWVIENSFLLTFAMSGNTTCSPIAPVTSGFLVKNSIIVNTGGMTNYNITFNNCQFGVDGGYATNFNNQVNCVYNNCIFYKYTFSQNPFTINNQFNNCLTYLTQSPSATFDLNSWSGGGSGTANNCIINQNPLWLSAPSGPMFSLTPFSTRNVWNPAVQGGSPALNAGSDGTDIGLTGGSVPYNYLAEPKIPVIRRYQLVNAVVPPNGTVTVNATATKAQ